MSKDELDGAIQLGLDISDGLMLGLQELAKGEVLERTCLEVGILGWKEGCALQEVLGGRDLLEVFLEGVLGFNDAVHLRFLATEVDVVAGGGGR